jgi:flagellar basal body-associated protein FliL
MKNRKLTMFMVSYVVALIAFSVAGYYVYADFSIEASRKSAEDERSKSSLAYIELPHITIALPSLKTGLSGNVRLDIALAVENRYAAKIDGFRPRIADRLIDYCSRQNFDEFTSPRSLLWLREDLLQEANIASAPFPIKDIIFRKFVVL